MREAQTDRQANHIQVFQVEHVEISCRQRQRRRCCCWCGSLLGRSCRSCCCWLRLHLLQRLLGLNRTIQYEHTTHEEKRNESQIQSNPIQYSELHTISMSSMERSSSATSGMAVAGLLILDGLGTGAGAGCFADCSACQIGLDWIGFKQQEYTGVQCNATQHTMAGSEEAAAGSSAKATRFLSADGFAFPAEAPGVLGPVPVPELPVGTLWGWWVWW